MNSLIVSSQALLRAQGVERVDFKEFSALDGDDTHGRAIILSHLCSYNLARARPVPIPFVNPTRTLRSHNPFFLFLKS